MVFWISNPCQNVKLQLDYVNTYCIMSLICVYWAHHTHTGDINSSDCQVCIRSYFIILHMVYNNVLRHIGAGTRICMTWLWYFQLLVFILIECSTMQLYGVVGFCIQSFYSPFNSISIICCCWLTLTVMISSLFDFAIVVKFIFLR